MTNQRRTPRRGYEDRNRVENRGRLGDFIVHDNGRSIAEAEIASPGSLGILGMKERVALLGGELTIQRAPDAGTIVTARIPIRGTPLHTKGTV